jgi:hypothetical protein
MDAKSSLLHGCIQEYFTWNNLLPIFKMTPTFFVALRNLSMALSNLFELGMLIWIAFFFTPIFLDIILTPMYIPKN